jgi:hypothetical protein
MDNCTYFLPADDADGVVYVWHSRWSDVGRTKMEVVK